MYYFNQRLFGKIVYLLDAYVGLSLEITFAPHCEVVCVPVLDKVFFPQSGFDIVQPHLAVARIPKENDCPAIALLDLNTILSSSLQH